PDTGISEYVAVDPNTVYRFSAYTKAQDITSASGPRITLQDAYSGESYVLTEDSLGTTGWRQQSADFKTGPQTNMLAVKIVRVPGNALIKRPMLGRRFQVKQTLKFSFISASVSAAENRQNGSAPDSPARKETPNPGLTSVGSGTC